MYTLSAEIFFFHTEVLAEDFPLNNFPYNYQELADLLLFGQKNTAFPVWKSSITNCF